jgi:hypothetical protein
MLVWLNYLLVSQTLFIISQYVATLTACAFLNSEENIRKKLISAIYLSLSVQ